MATQATAVNSEILRWAREAARLSVEQVAQALKEEPRVVASWEDGTGAPTYEQLDKMVSLYKRPAALFFFPEPPDEEYPMISVYVNDGEQFDRLVHGGSLRDTLDGIAIATKEFGTSSGRFCLVVSFLVELPDGELTRVQTVTTLREFLAAAQALAVAHEKEIEEDGKFLE